MGAVTLSGMWSAATWLVIGIPGYQDETAILQIAGLALGVPIGAHAGMTLGRRLGAGDAWADGVLNLAILTYVALSVVCLWACVLGARATASDPDWPMHAAKWIGAIAPLPLWGLMFARSQP